MQNTMSRVLVAALAMAFISTSVAEAAPKYERESPKLKIKVKKTNRTRGLERKAKAAKKEDKGPELTADDFIQIQGQVKNKSKTIQVQGQRYYSKYCKGCQYLK